MLYLNTVRDMVASASAFGLTSLTDPDRYGLSLTLGGGEVRMVDMATAFSVFANAGIRRDLVSVLKVVDKNGKVLQEYKDQNLGRAIPSQLLLQGPRIVSPETAFLISQYSWIIMRGRMHSVRILRSLFPVTPSRSKPEPRMICGITGPSDLPRRYSSLPG